MPRMITGLNKDLDQELEDWGFALETAAETCSWGSSSRSRLSVDVFRHVSFPEVCTDQQ
ncbi:hypothetical protein SNOG_07624 [Parastagonospora nodorum SN15]|uniref:Uncharacterized protein n=1 Tax=Phaeosphaeria nodorum (strain SN15 / ATCC MYA-4574 / FGSC 10173) TaxID=321614 RepID=Q0UKU0_PHANO|nr:hypothetical protein SNOG_07624 [Parastagonospora nodorum SN15]EAT85090.1 hypothetical protein SNOG_07624 [Parastagonospora nodorum SN15]